MTKRRFTSKTTADLCLPHSELVTYKFTCINIKYINCCHTFIYRLLNGHKIKEPGDISTSAHACSSLSAWITVAFRRRRRKNGSKKPIFLTLPCIHKIRFEWWGCLCESCYNVLQIKMTHCILNKHSIDKNSDVQQLTNKIISILILWVWWLKFLCRSICLQTNVFKTCFVSLTN